MDVAIVTVGDELLSGDTENTNATWLARRLTERGATVTRMLTIPDDRALIAESVGDYADAFDAVIATGGLGDTPDDVTMEAVADAFDRDLVVEDEVRETVAAKARAFREANPDVADEHDFDVDVAQTAATPEGSRPLLTEASFNPGCVVENVYVFPGFPEELRVMFDGVADEFGGDVVSRTFYTPAPEGALIDTLDEAREAFDLAIGSYPSPGDDLGRVKVTGTDPDAVDEAVDWLQERISVAEPDEE